MEYWKQQNNKDNYKNSRCKCIFLFDYIILVQTFEILC